MLLFLYAKLMERGLVYEQTSYYVRAGQILKPFTFGGYKVAIVRFLLSVSTGALLFAGSSAWAEPVSVDLSSFANGSWCNVGGGPLVNCNTLPTGTQSVNGQTFNIAGANGGNNAWFSSVAANNSSGTVSLVVPVNVANVVNVYTLMNTMWGQSVNAYDTITFTGSQGATYSVALLGNYAVRDYNRYIWTNSISATANSMSAWNNYSVGGWQRLDEQVFALPSDFADQTLNTITITDMGNDNFSRLFLAGLTLDTADTGALDPPSSVPEPAALLLSAGGLIGLGLLGRRRSGV
jgi:hypothetical protein